MMSRRELREQIFKFIFRVEFNEMQDMPFQQKLFLEDDELRLDEEDSTYIANKSDKILEVLPKIDEDINARTKGWTTERMSKVDLTIIRLAVYEICYDEDVPTNVAINEAVELAKKFGTEDSSSFVNGILARFADN